MSVELALAVLATIDICVNRGSQLVKKWQTYHHASSEIEERIVRFELSWLHVNDELEFLKRIAEDLDKRHLQVFKRSLDILGIKLDNAFAEIDKVVTASHRGLTYVMKKESIDRTLDDLQNWRKDLEPAWYLVMLISNPRIDTEIQAERSNSKTSPVFLARSVRNVSQLGKNDKTPIFLGEAGLEGLPRASVLFSNMHLVSRGEDAQDLALELLQCPNDDATTRSAFVEDVRDLARKLTRAEPHLFRLLNCKGVIKHEVLPSRCIESVTLAYRFPEGCSKPRTLRECLLAGGLDHSLSERFRLANEVARAINYIHLLGFVHRAIRPEKILIFNDGQTQIGSLFVVGFESFRAAKGQTRKIANSSWLEDLYRHPDRQGDHPSHYYVMQHDIYSLGVCLIEIGLWTSLAIYAENNKKSMPGPQLQSVSQAIQTKDSEAIKQGLVHLAQTLLPPVMGSLYAHLTVTCLTCLDEDNQDFGNQEEFRDDDGVLVATRYIEKILTQLNELKV